MSIPPWSESIRHLYLSGAANQFVLHGNVADRLLVPAADGVTIGNLAEFLTNEQLRRFDLVLSYGVGSGIRVSRGSRSKFEQNTPATANPPPFEWIDFPDSNS
jgi:hypothetical protein